MPKRTNVRNHTRTAKSGKVSNVIQHLRQLPKDVNRKIIAFETEHEKKKLESLKKQLASEEQRRKDRAEIVKLKEEQISLKKKSERSAEERLDEFRKKLLPSITSEFEVFKRGGVFEVKKGLFDRHALKTKQEADDYKRFRIENEIRKEAGAKKIEQKFNFVELPEIKTVKSLLADPLTAKPKKMKKEDILFTIGGVDL